MGLQEFRPGRFEILPPVIKNLLIINVLVFLSQQVFAQSGFSIEDNFALHTWQSSLFKPWQFVTHMFMHGGWDHIFSNMFALWMFGSILENAWGQKRFLTFYIICGLGAALCHMTVLYFENENLLNQLVILKQNFNPGTFINFYTQEHIEGINADFIHTWQASPNNIAYINDALHFCNSYVDDQLNEPTLGASGAVFGCLAAFGYLFPNTYIYLYFFFPIKAKWFVLIYIGVELSMTIQNSAGDNVAHVAHLGGALAGFAMVYFWNKNNRKTFY